MSVRYALLGLLAQRPRHGYELRAAFSAFVGGGAWDVKPAQIYTTLNRLEEVGLVQTVSDLGEGDEPDRRVYAVTPDGQAALREWLAAGSAVDHLRDEFFVKMMLALALEDAEPERVIRTQRARLYQELHAATGQRDAFNPALELAPILLLDKAIMHLEADLRWLDFVEARLDDIKSQPLPALETRPRGRPRKGVTEAKDPPAIEN
jgi:DNA-binding PadR family transcriptional regulator